jgi:uncharacterized protein
MTQDRYIPGVPCWVDTNQPDPQAAAEFCGGLFGWELEDQMPPEPGAALPRRPHPGTGRRRHQLRAAGRAADRHVEPLRLGGARGRPAEKVREAGRAVLSEPFDVFDAGRMAVCSDPKGAVFGVWQPNRHRGATVVNEHGAVNCNDLHTR